MRERILVLVILAATVVACTRRQSLFMEPGRADPATGTKGASGPPH